MIAASPFRPLGTAACPLRARLASVPATAGPSQFPPDHLVERARELAVSLLPGMQVHPRGPGGGVAHPVHQLSERGARLTGQRVPSSDAPSGPGRVKTAALSPNP